MPIVETSLGEPVVAAWISQDGVERRYIVPAETPWPLLLQWLLERSLPEYVPNAMRRARRPLATDETLMTRKERSARAALTELEADYAARRTGLEREVQAAQTAASVVRDGLLHGTGGALVDAVRSVLESAGVTVVDLDDQLGGTKNADLLCTYDGHSRLVEVKSASGNAPERAYEDLVRHLREWAGLPGRTPVEGGALVLNHQHRASRTRGVASRIPAPSSSPRRRNRSLRRWIFSTLGARRTRTPSASCFLGARICQRSNRSCRQKENQLAALWGRWFGRR